MKSDWKHQLLRQARLKGMCAENIVALRDCPDRLTAVALYKKTIDWALENDYPTLYDIRTFFGDCKDYGIYVDQDLTGVTANKHQVYVFHNCYGKLNVEMDYDNHIIPMLYFANDCDVTVVCKQPNFRPIKVPIYTTDGNNVETYDTANAVFKKYGI